MNDEMNKNEETEVTHGADSGDDVVIDTDGADESVVAEESAQETIKKLRAKLAKAVAEKQEYLNGWQKDKAEFLNARKRDKESNEQFIKFANENLIAELIPVLDSFNMAMGNKETWEKVDKNWRMGIEYIQSQLVKVLTDAGLVIVDPIGLPFDPMRDEAIGFDPVDDEKKNNTVTTVIQKGYSLNGKAVKAPRVKVGEMKK